MPSTVVVAFWAAERPIVKVLLTAGMGAIASTAWAGLLVEDMREKMAKLLVRLLLPCLLLYTLGNYATLENIGSWFWVPLFVLYNNLAGLGLGYLLNWMAGKGVVGVHESTVLLATSMGNHGTLPLACAAAICRFAANIGESIDGTESRHECENLALSVVSFSLWSGDLYNFIAGPYFLQRKDKEKDDYEAIPPVKSKEEAGKSKGILETAWDVLSNVELPIIAVLIGLLIGTVPFIKETFHGHGAPLNPLSDALRMVGVSVVPLSLLILGGNLMGALTDGGNEKETLHPLLFMGVILIRLALLPMLGIATVLALQAMGVLSSDPLVVFLMLLEMSTPTGITLSYLMNYYQVPGRASISLLLIVQYAVTLPVLTGLITYYILVANGYDRDVFEAAASNSTSA